MFPLHRRRARLLGVASAVVLLVATSTAPASAAVSFSATNVMAEVNGASVTALATLSSSARTAVDVAGLCARSSTGQNVDFPEVTSVVVQASGIALQATRTFGVGTYTYQTCVLYQGSWLGIGPTRSFTVSPGANGGAATRSALPVGNLPGWKQVFAEDFNTPLARGAFPGNYKDKWMSYDGFTDTSKVGDYDQSIISAQNGNLDLFLHSENGRPLGAAPIPLVNGDWGGQVYGRFSVRMRADPIAGYGTGFLLWSDSGNWNDGEIDFPESGLDDVVKGYNHCPGNASVNCLVVNTNVRYSDWHTYTIDWTPEKLSYLVDSTVVSSTTRNIPSKPLHWVMQVATTGDARAAASSSGHLLIDWATIYTRQ